MPEKIDTLISLLCEHIKNYVEVDNGNDGDTIAKLTTALVELVSARTVCQLRKRGEERRK